MVGLKPRPRFHSLSARIADTLRVRVALEHQVDQKRSGVGQHLGDGRPDLPRLLDAAPATPIDAGHLVEVQRRRRQVERKRIVVFRDVALFPVLFDVLCSNRYDPLLQTTNFASTLCRAADHSAWIVYMLPPSPVNPMTVRSGFAILAPMAPGMPTPSEPPRVRKCSPVRRGRAIAHERRRTRQRLVEDDRHRLGERGQLLHEARHLERRGRARPCPCRTRPDASVLRPAGLTHRAAAASFCSGVSTWRAQSVSAGSVSFGSPIIGRCTRWFFAIS
jgi:hypothetical protein